MEYSGRLGDGARRSYLLAWDNGRGYDLLAAPMRGENTDLLDEGRPSVVVFKFVGIDIFAAVKYDDVLFPAHDVQEAVMVEAAQVAGVEPAVAVDRFARQGLVFVVSREHAVAAEQDLADAVLVRIEDPHIAPFQDRAHRPGLGLVGRAYCYRAEGLGEAIPFEDVESHVPEPCPVLFLKGGAAGDDEFEPAAESAMDRDEKAPPPRIAEQRAERGRHGHERRERHAGRRSLLFDSMENAFVEQGRHFRDGGQHGDAVVAERFHDERCIDIGDSNHHHAAAQRAGDARGEPEYMMERQHGQHPVTGPSRMRGMAEFATGV